MRAECTWGDGPDVLLILDNTEMVLHENPYNLDKFTYGIVRNGSMDLTTDEAFKIAADLISAANQAKELDAKIRDVKEIILRGDGESC